jgi:hypothetical protein
MNLRLPFHGAVILAVCFATMDCSSSSSAVAPMMAKTSAPSTATQSILGQIANYKTWPNFPENTTPKQSQSHGPGAWVIAFHNDVVTQAMASGTLPLADGAIIVKENYAHETDSAPMALTTMAKQKGAWYWIESTPDGQVVDDSQSGTPYEGPNVALCTGCHAQKRDNDWIFTHRFALDGGVSDASTD